MIFAQLAAAQAALRSDTRLFKAHVETIEGEQMLVIEHANPRAAFALLDAVGSVFGEAWVLDGCESCGYDSKIGVVIHSDAERTDAS